MNAPDKSLKAAPTPADLTIDDVRAAAQRIEGAVVKTPMMHSITLSEITGAEVWLKFENLQFTAAYKERGALNALLQLTEEQRTRGVIAASAGNHIPLVVCWKWDNSAHTQSVVFSVTSALGIPLTRCG